MADTNVLAYLTAASQLSTGYQALLHERHISLSFQVRAELLEYPQRHNWGTRRTEALELLIQKCVSVPHTEAATTWYARVTAKRGELRNPAEDSDVWVVAQALEHSVPFMSNDRAAIELARGMGLETLTMLPEA